MFTDKTPLYGEVSRGSKMNPVAFIHLQSQNPPTFSNVSPIRGYKASLHATPLTKSAAVDLDLTSSLFLNKPLLNDFTWCYLKILATGNLQTKSIHPKLAPIYQLTPQNDRSGSPLMYCNLKCLWHAEEKFLSPQSRTVSPPLTP